jgi:Flp pilus assembly protein TadD
MQMRSWLPVCAAVAVGWLLFQGAATETPEEKLARYRNLGKAFYENPTTQKESVEEFRKALQLAPNSARERLNYGLALLRAGRTAEGVVELERVQKQDPKLPHTWFNLGIVYKKQAETEKALAQLEGLLKLVPDDAITHYNLGALYKTKGDNARATREFETAAKLDPNLAAPHFQLFNVFRTSEKPEDARRELEIFQRLKKQQEGSSEDVEWNQYAEVYDVMADKPASDTAAVPAFEETKLAGAASGVVAVDANNDGKPELVIWSQTDLRLEPGLKIADLTGVVSVTPGDFNNDGFVDLCVLTNSGAILFENRNGKFQRSSVALPKLRFEKAVWLDFDHDYDVDLVLLGNTSMLFRNQGTAGFEDHTAAFPFAKGAAIAAARFRVVADTKGMDLAVSYRDHTGILYRDNLAGKYTAEPLPVPAGARELHPVDLDNDGWFDLAYVVADRLELLHNGKLKFAGPTPLVSGAVKGYVVVDVLSRGVQDVVTSGAVAQNRGGNRVDRAKSVTLPSCESGDAVDLNGDQRTDVACLSDGQVHVLTNRTASKNNWVTVKLGGVKNLKTAPGSEVEVKAGARYQKQIYRGIPLTFGLGLEKDIDTVRITWPNGLIQNEIKQPSGKLLTYAEAQRLSGSCPMIWTWNGKEFEYITDVLGVAPLGASSGDGKYFPVDHDEYIQIAGASLVPSKGEYQVRITEELSEVAYLDQVQLIAVDHPANTTIVTNDNFKSPPFPDFRLFGTKERIRPNAARDDKGHDVLPKLLTTDAAYPDTFRRDLSGKAELHTLDLDFRGAAPDNRAVLVLRGWVDWADGSTFLAAAQETKEGLITPYLQVKDNDGNWKTVIEDMGMPAGKPKTIAVDLAGKFLSDSREIRVVTNLCVYWDEIYLGNSSAAPRVTQTIVPQSTANLHFRGFSPNRIEPDRKQPEQFFYEDAKPVSMWNPTPGMYTRYGAVEELTASVDDKLVVMGSGDELVLHFNARALPPVAAGWTRDFLLKVDGWAKDRDANTAYSQTTEPLPFHGMSRFPYAVTEHFPDDPDHKRYRREYLTRPALQLIRPLRAAR